mmetsp:Transcript_159965/g.513243  ORF Transcript_159965/g.513243 Transcript_159965/m.513243 type:complete len:234 (-) Transcript_159965:1070-1771(-)
MPGLTRSMDNQWARLTQHVMPRCDDMCTARQGLGGILTCLSAQHRRHGARQVVAGGTFPICSEENRLRPLRGPRARRQRGAQPHPVLVRSHHRVAFVKHQSQGVLPLHALCTCAHGSIQRTGAHTLFIPFTSAEQAERRFPQSRAATHCNRRGFADVVRPSSIRSHPGEQAESMLPTRVFRARAHCSIVADGVWCNSVLSCPAQKPERPPPAATLLDGSDRGIVANDVKLCRN